MGSSVGSIAECLLISKSRVCRVGAIISQCRPIVSTLTSFL